MVECPFCGPFVTYDPLGCVAFLQRACADKEWFPEEVSSLDEFSIPPVSRLTNLKTAGWRMSRFRFFI